MWTYFWIFIFTQQDDVVILESIKESFQERFGEEGDQKREKNVSDEEIELSGQDDYII